MFISSECLRVVLPRRTMVLPALRTCRQRRASIPRDFVLLGHPNPCLLPFPSAARVRFALAVWEGFNFSARCNTRALTFAITGPFSLSLSRFTLFRATTGGLE